MIKPGMFIGDRYEIIDKVGSGGMADVYKAKCHKLNRFVAVKIMKPEFSNDKTFVAKFRAEAQSAAGLSHPNIVNVYDVGEDEGLYFIVMELIEGITLKSFIERKGRLDIRESVGIAIQIAQGMEAAHANHIIHRDIKPQNIIISKEGKVKVADFGIAKATSSKTLTSNAMGSVHYISPEQARGGYSDEKSDIYSLGVTMYEMISGRVPFEGDSAVSIALLHIQSEAPTLGEVVGSVPISVDKIVQKCMQKKPERRYLSAAELIADLKHSILEPDVDFVVMSESMLTNSPTIALSQEDLDVIRNGVVHNTDNFLEEQKLLASYNNNYIATTQAPLSNTNSVELNENGVIDEEDELDDETIDPKVEKFAVYAAYGVVAIIVIVLVYVIFFSSDTLLNDDSAVSASPAAIAENEEDAGKIKVPNVEGLTEKEAKEKLEASDIKVSVISEVTEEDNVGKVLKQNPKAGEKVEEDEIVTITIGRKKGEKMARIPNDLVGKKEEEAKQKLLAAIAGLNEKSIIIKDDTESDEDEGIVTGVYRGNKAAGGQEVPENDPGNIVLKVSTGKKDSLPSNLLGKSEAVVKKYVEEKGYKVEKAGEEPSDKYAKGTVCRIEPEPGTKISKDYVVRYYISTGKNGASSSTETARKTVSVILEGTPFSGIELHTGTENSEIKTVNVRFDISYKNGTNQGSSTETKEIKSTDTTNKYEFVIPEAPKGLKKSDVTVKATVIETDRTVNCSVDSIK